MWHWGMWFATSTPLHCLLRWGSQGGARGSAGTHSVKHSLLLPGLCLSSLPFLGHVMKSSRKGLRGECSQPPAGHQNASKLSLHVHEPSLSYPRRGTWVLRNKGENSKWVLVVASLSTGAPGVGWGGGGPADPLCVLDPPHRRPASCRARLHAVLQGRKARRPCFSLPSPEPELRFLQKGSSKEPQCTLEHGSVAALEIRSHADLPSLLI